jgi:hypothetical protein
MDIEQLQKTLADKEAIILTLTLQNIDMRIDALEHRDNDKESRLRAVESSRTKFETLAWLAFGGGAVSLINILTNLKP